MTTVGRGENQARAVPLRTRPPVEQDRIVAYIRAQIRDGHLPPGARVPGRLELIDRFQVSAMTVQRAFDRLLADGFVEVRGRRGTFVCAAPADRHLFVLAFPQAQERPMRFWSVLAEVARDLVAPPDRLKLLYEVDQHTGSAGYAELLEDVRQRRIAGIFFATDPFLIAGTPILTEPGVPRIAIAEGKSKYVSHSLNLGQAMLPRAVAWLAGRGRRRLVHLNLPGAHRPGEFARLLAAHGLACPPWAEQGLTQSGAAWAEQLTLLLFALPPDQRPDGLVIGDDHLTDAVCRALLRLGLTAADLDVVTHCNFPEPPPAFPVTRLGYDNRALLKLGLQSLRNLAAGQPVPPVQRLDPQFEWELPTHG
jgi:DNA-binding transcriptional regulator YhcF (GntR family)